uniref:Uncharacterized protein n=1 Tax=Anopheles albimanus TaxID=7167 RepID=A0A182FYE7_ANOAL
RPQRSQNQSQLASSSESALSRVCQSQSPRQLASFSYRSASSQQVQVKLQQRLCLVSAFSSFTTCAPWSVCPRAVSFSAPARTINYCDRACV